MSPAHRTAWRLLVAATCLLAVAAFVCRRDAAVLARAAAPLTPDDRGALGTSAGWTHLQWNFIGHYGVDARQAWGNLVAAGAPGGAGVTVAVLDTGVAYPSSDPSRPGSPDLRRTEFVPGYDFVDNDAVPYDDTGHGTHVASTIAEQTNNGYGLTGLAYGVRLMPVRVLDEDGDGDAVTIAKGLRFAASHGAKVINLSFTFDWNVSGRRLKPLLDAIEYAHQRRSVIVASAGNDRARRVAYPAMSPHVIAVGATTSDGCLARYSNHGVGLDVVAPGGGRDAPSSEARCNPARPGLPISQVTMQLPGASRFGIVGLIGTSMATPHVSAIAALVVASGVLGHNPSPDAVEARIEKTARDLGSRGYDERYGWGLVNAAAATKPGH